MRTPRILIAALFVSAAAAFLLADDFPYHKPSKVIAEALNALPTPGASISPQRDYVIFTQGIRYPSISEVAQPMLRLAGIRIDTNTNGMHLAPYSISFELKHLTDGADIKISTPANAKLGAPVWSPDGKQFAFTNTTGSGIELWLGTS